MPTGAFASHYWPGDEVVEPPTVSPGGYMYPWSFDGTRIGMFYPFVKLSREHQKQLYGLWIRLKRRLPLKLIALCAVIKLIFSKDFNQAVEAVKATAQTPSSRDIKFWTEIARRQLSNPVDGENIFRHFHATLSLPSVPRDHRSVLVSIAWDAIRQTHGN